MVLAGGGAVAAATAAPLEQAAATCTPAGAIRIVLENPKPFDSIAPGSATTMSGLAFDPAATSGTGIDAVTVFLGAREAGGIFLGQATLGQPNPESAPVANAGFTLRTNSFPSGTGSRTIFVYAHSSVSNREANIQVPIFLGPSPTAPAGSTATPTITPTPPSCTPVPTATATSTPAPAAAAAAPAPATAPTSAAVAQAAPTSAVAPLPTLPPAALPPVSAATPTPRPTSTPVVPRPAATAALAVAPATATTAPRGGGIPPELGLPLLLAGASTVLGGAWLRRRERSSRDGGPTA
jgi:hypothetical protein